MDGEAFIEIFREEARDLETPPLWRDELVLRYLHEAQIEFCQLTEGIEDSTSAVCSLAVPEGTPVVALSSKIRKIRAATLAAIDRPLTVLSVEEARREGISLASVHTGVPRVLITGVGPAAAQLYPIPAVDVTIRLDVFRLPLKPIADPSDRLELDDSYVSVLMSGVLYRAYRRPDPDTTNLKLSESYQGLFRSECAAAKAAQGRLRNPSRGMAYGGY
jgi:hypothetical protein